MKRFLSLMLCGALAMSLVACGSSGSTSETTAAAAAEETAADTTPSDETTAAGSAAAGEFTPGTYTASAEGYNGTDISVTVVIDDTGLINAIDIDESQNTNQLLSDSQRESMAAAMISAQTPLVDGISGATFSSNGIIEAVKEALTSAGATGFSEVSKTEYQRDDISFTPGTYEAVKMGMNGEIHVAVTFSENAIESIEVLSSFETSGIGTKGMEILTDHILADQSLGVDTVTGATFSSLGFLDAVEDCVKQAGGNVDALKSFDVFYDTYEDLPHEADVIVVGGGVAGMITALSCKQNGLDVILLEQKEFLGGSALAATGTYLLGDTSVQAAQGIEDDPQAFYDWAIETIDNADPELVRMLVDHSQDLVDYFAENGLYFDETYMKATTNSDIPRGHQILPTGSGSVALMEEALQANDIDIRYLTKATGLITDSEGTVIGVDATDSAGDETAYYGDYIVLATGGFGDNQDILKTYWGPQYETLRFGGIKGSDGTMLLAAMDLGADTVDMDATHIDATLEISRQIVAETNILTSCGGIVVSSVTGHRIADEAANHGDAISKAEEDEGEEYYYMIFDDSALEFSDAVTSKVSLYIASGLAETYGSIGELAEGLGLDEDVLSKVIGNYNSAVRGEAEDEFGRTAFFGELEAPYYVMRVANGVVMTSGGLKVDSLSRVIDTNGEPIPGLYAAGEVTGGLMRVYIAGASLSECGIAGMLIGRELSGD